MHVNGKHYRTVWMKGSTVYLIDQTLLPYEFQIFEAVTYKECCFAIKNMVFYGIIFNTVGVIFIVLVAEFMWKAMI